jgi:acyl-coenzyme A thioesterase PaaI-like protein
VRPVGIEYRVVATNPATASENRIHADDVARRYGFDGGLVPGVNVYGYACPALGQALGAGWAARGGAHVRFLSPAYEGEELVVTVCDNAMGCVEFAVISGERTAAAGSAFLSERAPGGVEFAEVPAAPRPAPDDRPVASEEFFVAGRVLGSVPLATDQAAADAYLTAVAEPSTVYALDGVVHPGQVLQGANRALIANVVLPAWLHVESHIQYLRAVSVGEDVQVRARVAEVFERKGHRFARLDVGWVAGAELVAAGRHTAIWQLAGS